MSKAYHLGILPSDHNLALVLGLAFGVITVGVAHPYCLLFTFSPVHLTLRPSHPLMLNLQSGKLGRAIAVHDDQPGDVLVGLPQVETCRFQFRTQQGALVLQHLYAGWHPQFKACVIDQIVFHHLHAKYWT